MQVKLGKWQWYFHLVNVLLYIYIYIYVCVCVCVCVRYDQLWSWFGPAYIMYLQLNIFLRLVNLYLLYRELSVLISCYIKIILFQIKFSTYSNINFQSTQVTAWNERGISLTSYVCLREYIYIYIYIYIIFIIMEIMCLSVTETKSHRCSNSLICSQVYQSLNNSSRPFPWVSKPTFIEWSPWIFKGKYLNPLKETSKVLISK